MQKGQTLIFLLVGIIILGLVAGGIYFLGTKKKTLDKVVSEQNPVIWPVNSPEPDNKPSPDTSALNTSDETAGWKTYTSNEYKYTVMYPPQINYSETLDTAQYNRSHVFFKLNGGTLEIYGVCGRGAQPLKRSEITIAGQKTEKLYETAISGVIVSIPRPNSNESVCFNFTLPSDPAIGSSVDKTFDQILSTFKFTQ